MLTPSFRPGGLGIEWHVGDVAWYPLGRDGLVDGVHDIAGTGHLNRGFDGVFEIVRVVSRRFVSIAEVTRYVPERTWRRVSPRWRAIDSASWSVIDPPPRAWGRAIGCDA